MIRILNDNDVIAIHALGSKGLKYPKIAKMFNISPATVFDICKCKTHKYLGLAPTANRLYRDARSRILELSELNHTSGCWEWRNRPVDGYGVISIDGKQLKAHRVSYNTFIGPIPDGLFVCHKCDNRACVNPDHLFTGTNQDNVNDKVSKGRQSRHSMPGSSHPNARLKEADVVKILHLIHNGDRIVDIARSYDVSEALIRAIRNKRKWRHVETNAV